ncbi:MAG: hypothetical protein ACJ8C4_17615 [Gemmataceae bacterium]
MKFKGLIRALKLPKPYVRGLLETMWDVANECGDPGLGTAQQVEDAAEWPGKPGVLFAALKRLRFIDLNEETWVIHDYFDHAPHYVRLRAERESERRKAGKTISDIRRDAINARWDKPPIQIDTNENHLNTNNVTPAPAPAPAPAPPIKTKDRSARPAPTTDLEAEVSSRFQAEPKQRPMPVPSDADDYNSDFVKFWKVYPRKVAKAKAAAVWMAIAPDPDLVETIVAAVERQKLSSPWNRGEVEFIPHASTWLNNKRWEDEVQVATADNYTDCDQFCIDAGVKPHRRRKRTPAEMDEAEAMAFGISVDEVRQLRQTQKDALLFFCERWRKIRGQDYALTPTDSEHAGMILEALGRDIKRFRGVVKNYLANTDPFVAEKNGHSLSYLAKNINVFNGNPPSLDDYPIQGMRIAKEDEAQLIAFLNSETNVMPPHSFRGIA